MTTGIIHDMPERDYHNHPALSSTQLASLLADAASELDGRRTK